MSDMEQLFGSDSEDEGPSKDRGRSGSESPSASSDSGSSSSGSGSAAGSASPAGSRHSAASSASGRDSAPASPASGRDSAPASPASGRDSAPASPASGKDSSPASPASGKDSSPASPAQSDSGSESASNAGSSRSGSPASPAKSITPIGSPAPSDSAPASPAHSRSASRSRSPSHARSALKSPAGFPSQSDDDHNSPNQSEGSKHSPKHSDSAQNSPNHSDASQPSPTRQQEDSGSDSDIPRKGRARISDDSDQGSDAEAKRRQRLPSDSGSDPEAVRATAEDIFGEADDISDEEKDKEPEEKEEVIPETRIEVEIPRVIADLGDRLSFAKLPNFLSVETRPFDPSTYEDEIDEDEVMDEEGRARLKLKVENTIRWRYVKDPTTGESMTDEFGDKIRESNSKVVKWSDGSMSLHLGTEIFDVFSMPMQDHNHLYIRQGTGLQGQAMFKNKLSFRPHSTDSFTHRKMTMSLADRSSKTVKIKVLPIAGVDPELSKTDNIKKEEERLRASVRRENQQRRTRERGYGRGRLDASMLDDGVSINAIKSSYKKRTGAKSRNEELSDSADEEYETDGEDDVRHNRLQKAKRLDDSDDNSDDNNEVSDGETVKKKSKVMSGSESD